MRSDQIYIIFFKLVIRYKLTFAELMRIYFEWGAFPGVLGSFGPGPRRRCIERLNAKPCKGRDSRTPRN